MPDRIVFHDSVTPLPIQRGLTANGLMVNAAAPENLDAPMPVLFSLATPPAAEADLEEKVARGEVVSPEEQQAQYGASKADVDRLTSWLKEQGFEIQQVSPDNTSVYAQGT